jgi:hypothetical protein
LTATAEPLIPTADGMTWNYNAIQETMDSNSLELSESKKTERFAVTYKIAGAQKVDRKDVFKLAVYRGDALANTDLVTVDEHGIICHARLDENGAVTKFEKPQTLLSSPPLNSGSSWNFDGKIGDTNVSQRYQIAREEDVAVPAGTFHAWKIHCEQTSPTPAVIDRWFVPGTGFVKVVTTIRSSSGDLLQQTSMELKEPPKIAALPETKSVAASGSLSVGVSKEPEGSIITTLNSDTPAIYARWQGHDLVPEAKIHAVWIAEKVADVAPDSEIDDAEAVAPAPNAHGKFTLTRPEGGWTPGDYRVEFFVDDAPAGTVKLKIVK